MLRHIKTSIVIFTSLILLGIFILALDAAYITSYDGRVFPGVTASGNDIGGLNKKDIKNFIENLNNRYSKEGIALQFDNNGKTQTVKLSTVSSGEAAVELVRLDSEKLTTAALKIGRTGFWWEKLYLPLLYRFNSPDIEMPVTLNASVLTSALHESLGHYEDNVQNATVANINEYSGEAEVVPEKKGITFDYNEVIGSIKSALASLSFAPIKIEAKQFTPSVTSADVRGVISRLPEIVKSGPITLNVSLTPSSTPLEWTINSRQLLNMVEVNRNAEDRVFFSLNKAKVEQFLTENVLPAVETPAKDARFTMENNRVKEFEASTNGASIDIDASYDQIRFAFEARNYGYAPSPIIPLEIVTVYPKIQIANSNDLGITELVGTGTSTFKDSHTRRIQNIAHAVERLNGTLIKPGEEFSAIKYAGPFTLENGYVPEQVIKGKELKDEVGGGMCQIGTTLFRMAMQTGLPITERHNHSLVVQYYADPVNGNPGTDATLYEPILDLKFLNDTPNYLLLLTNIDYKKQLLTFSLWGTKDGRQGWYSHPKVSKWIPAPTEIEYVNVTPDKTGATTEQKCQSAFRGAVASFTYTRVTPAGEKIERVFDSYYRPLPKICPTTTPAVTPVQ